MSQQCVNVDLGGESILICLVVNRKTSQISARYWYCGTIPLVLCAPGPVCAGSSSFLAGPLVFSYSPRSKPENGYIDHNKHYHHNYP